MELSLRLFKFEEFKFIILVLFVLLFSVICILSTYVINFSSIFSQTPIDFKNLIDPEVKETMLQSCIKLLIIVLVLVLVFVYSILLLKFFKSLELI